MKQWDRTVSQEQINAKNSDGGNTVKLPLKRLFILGFLAIIVCSHTQKAPNKKKNRLKTSALVS